MWNIFYDVLLCAINATCPGITLTARKGEKGDPTSPPSKVARHQVSGMVVDQATLAAMAFVDDAAFLAPSREEMERLVEMVTSFNLVSGVRANASKGAMLTLNCSDPGPPLTIPNTNPLEPRLPIPFLTGKTPFRYLGVWISQVDAHCTATTAFESELKKGLVTLKNKAITGKMAVYFINSVIYPAALYRSANFVPRSTLLETYDGKFRALVRDKLKVDRASPSSLIHHPAIHGLESLENLVLRHHATELMIMLNEQGSVGTPARVCLGLAAWSLAMPCSPLTFPQPIAPPPSVCWFSELIPLLFKANLSISDENGQFAIDPSPHHHTPLMLSHDNSLEHRNPIIVDQLRKYGLHWLTQIAPEKTVKFNSTT